MDCLAVFNCKICGTLHQLFWWDCQRLPFMITYCCNLLF